MLMEYFNVKAMRIVDADDYHIHVETPIGNTNKRVEGKLWCLPGMLARDVSDA
jgi:hypothetical protein